MKYLKLLNYTGFHALKNNMYSRSKNESKLNAHWTILFIAQVWNAKIMASGKNNRN